MNERRSSSSVSFRVALAASVAIGALLTSAGAAASAPTEKSAKKSSQVGRVSVPPWMSGQFVTFARQEALRVSKPSQKVARVSKASASQKAPAAKASTKLLGPAAPKATTAKPGAKASAKPNAKPAAQPSQAAGSKAQAPARVSLPAWAQHAIAQASSKPAAAPKPAPGKKPTASGSGTDTGGLVGPLPSGAGQASGQSGSAGGSGGGSSVATVTNGGASGSSGSSVNTVTGGVPVVSAGGGSANGGQGNSGQDDPNGGLQQNGGNQPGSGGFPVLVPGNGFAGPTPQPPAVGDPSAAGYDAKAIARWDVVPFQTFDGEFNVGVVAFHMNGIEKVEFSVDGGPWEPVYEMKLNPQTDVWEYTATLRASDFADGAVEVRAIAWPAVGEPRVLAGTVAGNVAAAEHSLELFANSGGSLTAASVYVSPSGDDSSDGSEQSPFRTIKAALAAVPDGGRVVLVEPGRYVFGDGRKPARTNERWITVEAGPGISPDEIFVVEDPDDGLGWRMVPRVQRLKWEGITFDFRDIGQMYGQGALWFGDCVWTYSGWITSNYMTPIRDCTEGSYVTGCTARDAAYGFTCQTLVRGCTVERVGGDVFQNSDMVVSSTVSDLDRLTDHHLDLFQMWGEKTNLILYGIRAVNVRDTQVFFLEPTYYSQQGRPQHQLRDAAFVNMEVATLSPPTEPPYSQLISQFEHVIFRNVRVPMQPLMLRTDVTSPHNQGWHAHNMVFEDCQFYNTLQSSSGVTVR